MGCTCDEEYIEEHTCPFKEEIDGDEISTCNCCLYCQEQCMQDI